MYNNFITSTIPFLSQMPIVQTLHFVKKCSIPCHVYFLLKSYHTKFVFTHFFSKSSLLHSIIIFVYTHSILFTPTKQKISFCEPAKIIMTKVLSSTFRLKFVLLNFTRTKHETSAILDLILVIYDH